MKHRHNQEAAEWSVAIFSAREQVQTLASTIDAVLAACSGRRVSIEAIVNGNKELAAAISSELTSHSRELAEGQAIRIWFVDYPDKANAWNQYLHEIWAGEELAFCIDGYVRLYPDALSTIERGLGAAPEALAATGVPTYGRSAEKMRRNMVQHGGIHGNLYVLRGTAMRDLRDLGFRLPLGLYRTDPTLGAVLCFDLDPQANSWNTNRILVEPGATWSYPALSARSFRDIRTHFKRVMRQAQGKLENRAVRQHLAIDKNSPALFPDSYAELIRSWLRTHKREALLLLACNPLCLLTVRRVYAHQQDSNARREPELVASLAGAARRSDAADAKELPSSRD